jgi:phosphoribosylaminoimidazole-succinocarboxamide synthase
MKREPMLESNFPGLKLLSRGKVRDMYDLKFAGNLMVVTDRISAFDGVLPDPIPDKGQILNRMSAFWLDYLSDIVPNHFITTDVNKYPEVCDPFKDQLFGRSMLVRKAVPLPVECIVRGYISGSAWKAYQKNNVVCGHTLPVGLQESEKLPEAIFTPSTKAEAGKHDENISIEQMRKIVGAENTDKVAEICLRLYEKAAILASLCGIIIADTKFELGWFEGEIILIDEVLTPDSSRFWPKATYQIGRSQDSFDKQPLRDYLASIGWKGGSPAPNLPVEIIQKTRARYLEALERLTGRGLAD